MLLTKTQREFVQYFYPYEIEHPEDPQIPMDVDNMIEELELSNQIDKKIAENVLGVRNRKDPFFKTVLNQWLFKNSKISLNMSERYSNNATLRRRRLSRVQEGEMEAIIEEPFLQEEEKKEEDKKK